MTDPHDIRLEATCGTARVELRLTPSGFSVDEHLHTQPHVGGSGEAVSPGCEDARDQAEMLVALWGADGVAAAASGESRDVGHVAYRLAEPLRVGYSITTDGGVREESIRQLSEGQWVHVAVRNDIATAGTVVVNGPYASVAAALEANGSALRSNGTEATITCDDKCEVLLLDLLGGAEFEELVVNDPRHRRSQASVGPSRRRTCARSAAPRPLPRPSTDQARPRSRYERLPYPPKVQTPYDINNRRAIGTC
jgi:hypothetical protein